MIGHHCHSSILCFYSTPEVCECACRPCAADAEVQALRAAHDRVLERCNALFAENRALRLVASEEALFCVEVIARVAKARAKHPVCGLAGVTYEFAEVVREVDKGGAPERLRDECIDLAVTACRLALEGAEKKQ